MIFIITSVPNESYSIHASCALNLISTFLFDRIKDLYKWNKKTHSVGTGHKHQLIKWLKMLIIVTWSLVLYVVFCRSLFVLLYFVFWLLYCLLFFNIRFRLHLWYLQTLLKTFWVKCVCYFCFYYFIAMLYTFNSGDTKGVIRIRISQKNRQHNGQKKKYKQRSTKHTHKIKDRVTRTPLWVSIIYTMDLTN
jgi:hypothetical protein